MSKYLNAVKTAESILEASGCKPKDKTAKNRVAKMRDKKSHQGLFKRIEEFIPHTPEAVTELKACAERLRKEHLSQPENNNECKEKNSN